MHRYINMVSEDNGLSTDRFQSSYEHSRTRSDYMDLSPQRSLSDIDPRPMLGLLRVPAARSKPSLLRATAVPFIPSVTAHSSPPQPMEPRPRIPIEPLDFDLFFIPEGGFDITEVLTPISGYNTEDPLLSGGNIYQFFTIT